MALKTSERITKIKQKIDDNLVSFPIGTEPHLVDSVRGSLVNNLEEQFLIGAEVTTTSWEDADGVIHIEAEYCPSDSMDDHYKVEILDYCPKQTSSNNQDYNIVSYTSEGDEGQALLLPDQAMNMDNTELDIRPTLTSVYSSSNEAMDINPSVEIIIKVINLYFGGTKIMTKTYTRKYIDDKKIVKATITKY